MHNAERSRGGAVENLGAEDQSLGERRTAQPRATEIASRIAGLPAAALAACKACLAAAQQPGRGGYTDELGFTRQLLRNPETRQRVDAFLAESAESSTQTKRGATR